MRRAEYSCLIIIMMLKGICGLIMFLLGWCDFFRLKSRKSFEECEVLNSFQSGYNWLHKITGSYYIKVLQQF